MLKKIDLANFDAFKEALLASVDVRMRNFIFSRSESDIQRMYQRALTAVALRHLKPRGRYHVSIELCAQDESLALSTWWEAFLILSEHCWGAWIEEDERLSMILLENVGSCAEPTKPGADSNLPPPQEPFTPLPKSEIGGCARCDSSAPAI